MGFERMNTWWFLVGSIRLTRTRNEPQGSHHVTACFYLGGISNVFLASNWWVVVLVTWPGTWYRRIIRRRKWHRERVFYDRNTFPRRKKPFLDYFVRDNFSIFTSCCSFILGHIAARNACTRFLFFFGFRSGLRKKVRTVGMSVYTSILYRFGITPG